MADDQLSRSRGSRRSDKARHGGPSRRGDATVGQLASPYDVSVQAVSKHIKVLTDAGLVSRKQGRQRRPCHLKQGLRPDDEMDRAIPPKADVRYERLDAVLAEVPRRRSNRPTPTDTAARSSVMNTLATATRSRSRPTRPCRSSA